MAWCCRRCNSKIGVVMARHRLGRRTRQYNPAIPEADEWLIRRARATAGGGRIHHTEQLIGAYRMYGEVLKRKPGDRETRRRFYEVESELRAGLHKSSSRLNPTGGARSLAQWVIATQAMKGESDAMPVDAAVEMIRATPPTKRSEFAQEIWAKRRQRGTDKLVPF